MAPRVAPPHPLGRLCVVAATILVATACTQPALIGRDLDGETQIGGGVGADAARYVAIDLDGNSYVVGDFEGSIRFGDDVLDAGPSGQGSFLVSFDAAGQYRWARRWSAETISYSSDVEVAGDVVYVIGYAGGALTTPSATLPVDSTQDLVLLVFDRAGGETQAPIHVESATGNVQGKAIDVSDGALALIGHYVGDVDLGGGALGETSAGVDHGMVGVFDQADASLRFDAVIDGGSVQLEDGVLRDDGGVLAVGLYTSGPVLGEDALGERDGLVVMLDGEGTVRWHAALATAGDDALGTCAQTADGSVLVGGWLGGAVSGVEGQSPTRGGTDGFVARYDDDGTARWLRRIGGAGNDVVARIAVRPSGEIVAVGAFEGELTFAGRTLISRGGRDGVIVGLGPDGEERWSRQVGGPGDELVSSVEAVGDELVIAGSISEGAIIGGQTIDSVDGTDVFVHRFLPPSP